jgi:hypothetical protein
MTNSWEEEDKGKQKRYELHLHSSVSQHHHFQQHLQLQNRWLALWLSAYHGKKCSEKGREAFTSTATSVSPLAIGVRPHIVFWLKEERTERVNKWPWPQIWQINKKLEQEAGSRRRASRNHSPCFFGLEGASYLCKLQSCCHLYLPVTSTEKFNVKIADGDNFLVKRNMKHYSWRSKVYLLRSHYFLSYYKDWM